MRSIETKRTAALFIAALMIAALAAGPAAPASAQACSIPTSGEYTLPGDCTLTGTINVNGSLTIHGNGHTIDAAGNQAFYVDSGESLAMDNVTVTNGYTTGEGGAISSAYGTVTVSNSTFSGNSAGYDGGAISSAYGTVTVSNSTFSGNSAGYNGGAIANWYTTLAVTSSTFSGNTAGGAAGAIYNFGSTATISHSTFSGNTANGAGAIYNNDTLIIDGCSVLRGNTASAIAGGIYNSYNGTVDITGSVIHDEIYHVTGTFPAASTTAEGNWWGSAAGPGALAVNFTVNSWLSAELVCTVSGGGGPVILPKCEAVVPFGTVDPAPISGEVRFFTDFGYDLPLRPEGWLMGTVDAVAGEQTWGSVTVFCGNHVRAWLFDLEGSAVGLVPSQYENGDGVFAPYTEDYGVGGPEYGYVPAAPPLYTGCYADMFASE
jgi:predicted outer membrane repeat protein